MIDVFICDGIRTPIGRFGGALSGVRPDDLLAEILAVLAQRNADLPLSAIDEVVMGCANQGGEDNRNVARMSLLLAGLPDSLAATTINRLCGSGMDAIGIGARAIRAGEMDVVIAGGVESMSRAPLVVSKPRSAFDRTQTMEDTTIGWRFVNQAMKARYGVDSMPETAENVAEDFTISREDQDAFALRAQLRTATAQKQGRFQQEIHPIAIPQRKGAAQIFDQDEHPRPGTTLEKLAALPTPFRTGGTVTAGNASGVNDGAAAMILASAKAVDQFGLTPRAKILGMATAGVAPRIMGFGPAPATRKLLARLGHRIGDYDIIELNEAFASQALAVLRDLGIDDAADFVNPNGGAIALGHPLGMSGARLVLTASLELQNSGAKRALCTMCIGVGQGISLALERV